MDIVVPNQQQIDAKTPTIVLGGVAWPIPPLAIKQNRVVLPLLVDLFPEMAAVAGLRKPDGSMDQRAFMKAVMLFSENTLDKLIEVVYNALLRAHPTLTREQFNDMPIAPMELFGALEVISAAVGLLTRTDKVAAPGEA